MVTTDTTTARGLLMPTLKPNPKPKLIPLLMLGMDTMAVTDTDMAEDTMVDTTHTLTDTDTDTTVKKLFYNVISCHFLNNPPLELSKPILLPSAILLKLCFFYEKIVTKLIFGPIVIKNSQKMPLSKKGTCATTSSVLLSGYDIQLLSEIVMLSETVKPK